jgi:23S rRNA (pseudouridine1915-N3)-methyltransferase
MKVEFWMTGKTSRQFMAEAIDQYYKRIRQYLTFEVIEIKVPKLNSVELAKKEETDILIKRIKTDDFIILLDENGEIFDSRQFAGYLQKLFNSVNSKLVFISGGAYGFDKKIYERANNQISLSKMTFTHDLSRIIFLEQLYRALTIINNHPYQH